MPQSRKRPGHHPHQQPAAISKRQRTRGRTIVAILFAVFAGIMALFATGMNYYVLAAAIIIGALVGYVVGKNMEKNAK